jgi:hypothetical protein
VTPDRHWGGWGEKGCSPDHPLYPAIRVALETAIRNGTVVSHYVMDEPFHQYRGWTK